MMMVRCRLHTAVICTLYIQSSELLEEAYTYFFNTGEMYLGINFLSWNSVMQISHIHVHSLNVLCRKAIVISSGLMLMQMYCTEAEWSFRYCKP